jgi:hypothetical protein
LTDSAGIVGHGRVEDYIIVGADRAEWRRRCLGTAHHVQLPEDALEVRLHGAFLDVDLRADVAAALAVGEQRSIGERLDHHPLRELRRELGRKQRLSRGHAANGVEQFSATSIL